MYVGTLGNLSTFLDFFAWTHKIADGFGKSPLRIGCHDFSCNVLDRVTEHGLLGVRLRLAEQGLEMAAVCSETGINSQHVLASAHDPLMITFFSWHVKQKGNSPLV